MATPCFTWGHGHTCALHNIAHSPGVHRVANSGTEVQTWYLCLVAAAMHCPMPDSRHPWRKNRPWITYMICAACSSQTGIPIGARHSGLATGFPCSKGPDCICVCCLACFRPQEQHTGRMGIGRVLVLTTKYLRSTLALHLRIWSAPWEHLVS